MLKVLEAGIEPALPKELDFEFRSDMLPPDFTGLRV